MVGCSLSPDGSLRVVTSTPFAVVGAEPYKEDAMLCRTESQTLLAVSGVIITIVIFLSCAPAPTRNASTSLPTPAAPRREESAPSSRPDGPAASAQSADGGASPPTSASAPSLRNVDWCNRSLGPNVPALYNCRGSRDVRHRAGEGIHSLAEPDTSRTGADNHVRTKPRASQNFDEATLSDLAGVSTALPAKHNGQSTKGQAAVMRTMAQQLH